MSKNETKITRERKVKLSDNAEQNVKVFACARLNKALAGIRVFGNCYGSKFQWTNEQIEIAEQAILTAAETAIQNLRTGKKIASSGIKL